MRSLGWGNSAAFLQPQVCQRRYSLAPHGLGRVLRQRKDAPLLRLRDLAGDLAARNINVNALVPGFFPTKMTAHLREDDEVDPAVLSQIPMARLGRPDEIAGSVVFLSSRAGAYITGVALPVDGGVAGCG